RLGRVGGQLVPFPTYQDLEESDLDLVVSGTRDAVTMIEGFAREMPEDQMAAAIDQAQRIIAQIIGLVEQLRKAAGKPEKVLPPPKAEAPPQKAGPRQVLPGYARAQAAPGQAGPPRGDERAERAGDAGAAARGAGGAVHACPGECRPGGDGGADRPRPDPGG